MSEATWTMPLSKHIEEQDQLALMADAIQRVRDLADLYAEKAADANPEGHGEPLNDNNSVSYWRIANEIREALTGFLHNKGNAMAADWWDFYPADGIRYQNCEKCDKEVNDESQDNNIHDHCKEQEEAE